MEEHLAIIEDSLKQSHSQEEALKIVLSLSEDADSLNLFASSKFLVKLLIDLISVENLSNTALQVLINFCSQNQELGIKMITSGIFNVLFEYLKTALRFLKGREIPQIKKTNLRPDEKDEKTSIGYISTENVYVMKSATKSNVPLVLMLMSNLTIHPIGKEKFLNASENPDLKTYMLENIIGMTEFFKDSDIFNFGANIITNCSIDSSSEENKEGELKTKPISLKIFKSLFTMLTSIKKSPFKRLKITEAVKNLMFNYQHYLKEIKEYNVIVHIGKALIETNLDDISDVIEEDTKLNSEWLDTYNKRFDIKVEIGNFKDSLNHCLMDTLVLLANEEEMLLLMHEHGIQGLFELLNFQKYVKDKTFISNDMMYQSFMGDAKINEKVTIILNQIIAVLKNKAEETSAPLPISEGKE